MDGIEIILALAYVLYVVSPSFRDELWLRGVLTLSSVGFIVFGLLDDNSVVVVFNVIFVAISLFHVVRLIRQRKPVQLSPVETQVRDKLFPTLTHRQFLIFFQMGTRVELNGSVTTQGKPVGDLLVLLEGEIDVIRDGKKIALLAAPCFVGEMSYISGEPASATLTASGAARAQSWSQAQMAAIEVADPELSNALRGGIARDLVAKVHG